LLLVKELRVQNKIVSFNKAERPRLRKSEIPKTIIQYWDNAKIPVDVLECSNSWQKINPHYKHKLFNYDAALQFIGKNYSKDELTAFKNCTNAAMQSDFFRLCYLKKFGGVYVDIDDMCLNPLDELISAHAHIYLYQENIMSIANNLIATVPNHPIIEYAFNLVKNNLLQYNKESAWFRTGPANFTMAYANYMTSFLKEKSKRIPDVYIFGYSEIRKYIYQFVPLMYKRTNKNWRVAVSDRKVSLKIDAKKESL